ncbi:hypothetical protein ABQF35_11145 [Mycobacterium syngnathidarum]
MDDTALETAMRDRSGSWQIERRDLRRLARWETTALVFVVAPMAMATGWGAVVFRQIKQLRAGQQADASLSASAVVTELYHLVSGRVSSETALQVSLAAVALCATINVALAIDNAATGSRDPVGDSEWRSNLHGAVWIVCVGTLVVTMAAWANLTSPDKLGIAAAATLFTVVTMVLTRSVRRQSNRADRDEQLDTACTKLDRLTTWRSELTRLGVPPQQPDPPNGWRLLAACVWRLAIVAVLGILASAVTLIAGFLLIGRPDEFARGLSAQLIPVMAFHAYSTVALGGFIVFGSVLRRWSAYNCKTQRRRRWRLEIGPRLAYIGYLLFAALAVALAWADAGWIATVFTAGLLLPGPVIVIGVLWASRHSPGTRWIRVASEPVWGLVHRSLDLDRDNQQSTKERLLKEERAEIAERSRHHEGTQPAGQQQAGSGNAAVLAAGFCVLAVVIRLVGK